VKLPSAVASVVALAAQRHGLDPCVLAALVLRESSGDPRAIRHEPHYRWLWDAWEGKPFRRVSAEEASRSRPPEDFRGPTGASDATEWAAQRTSWGLCQVMGAVARERGYSGTFLSALCEPELGAEYGARHLSTLLRRWDLSDALSAYNAGAPTEANDATYVRAILRQAEVFRREGF
jgi:hypothetical protein